MNKILYNKFIKIIPKLQKARQEQKEWFIVKPTKQELMDRTKWWDET